MNLMSRVLTLLIKEQGINTNLNISSKKKLETKKSILFSFTKDKIFTT